MRKILIISGIIFLVLGGLAFFISQETVRVELLPFSFVLVMVLVAGVIMLGLGVVKSIGDFFQ